jgi:hypothetical protein
VSKRRGRAFDRNLSLRSRNDLIAIMESGDRIKV